MEELMDIKEKIHELSEEMIQNLGRLVAVDSDVYKRQDYWSKISRKYFDYYLSKQITFEEQGKNRFIKMLSYCGYRCV